MQSVAILLACTATMVAHHTPRCDRAEPTAPRATYRIMSSTVDGSFVIAAAPQITDAVGRTTALGAAVRLDASLMDGARDDAR